MFPIQTIIDLWKKSEKFLILVVSGIFLVVWFYGLWVNQSRLDYVLLFNATQSKDLGFFYSI